MSATGTVTIRGSIEGLSTGSRVFDVTITSSAAVDATTTVTLASGANTVTKPTGATCAVIVPPSGNAVTITFKGITTDTGVALDPAKPSLITMASAATTFCLTAGGSIAGVVIAWM